VGIAVGTGTDIAKEAGDVVLVSGDLAQVPTAVALSRAMMRRIRLGLFWAFAYNAVLVPLAAFGYLHPMLAAGAMGLSSVSVVANALTLRWFRGPRVGRSQ
jgi:Cu+-exporting ATPase